MFFCWLCSARYAGSPRVARDLHRTNQDHAQSTSHSPPSPTRLPSSGPVVVTTDGCLKLTEPGLLELSSHVSEQVEIYNKAAHLRHEKSKLLVWRPTRGQASRREFEHRLLHHLWRFFGLRPSLLIDSANFIRSCGNWCMEWNFGGGFSRLATNEWAGFAPCDPPGSSSPIDPNHPVQICYIDNLAVMASSSHEVSEEMDVLKSGVTDSGFAACEVSGEESTHRLGFEIRNGQRWHLTEPMFWQQAAALVAITVSGTIGTGHQLEVLFGHITSALLVRGETLIKLSAVCRFGEDSEDKQKISREIESRPTLHSRGSRSMGSFHTSINFLVQPNSDKISRQNTKIIPVTRKYVRFSRTE